LAQLRQQEQWQEQSVRNIHDNLFDQPPSNLGQPINHYDHVDSVGGSSQPAHYDQHYGDVDIQSPTNLSPVPFNGVDTTFSWEDPNSNSVLDNTILEWQPNRGGRQRRTKRRKNFWSFFQTKKRKVRQAHR